MQELVSIIMPSYNSQETISESIESVLNQTYPNWELLITDDCSADNTVSIVENYQLKDKRIKLFKNEINSGAGFSRNCSIKNACGRYIAFLDADDKWNEEKLTKQILFMENNRVAFSYTYYQKISSENGIEKLGTIIKSPEKINFKKLLYSNVIGCLTAIYDTKVFGKRYMPLIRKRQDMGLWLELLKTVDNAYCLPEALAFYRIDTGMTKNKFTVIKYQWEFYRKVMKLGLFKTLRLFPVYVLIGVLKKSA